MKTTLTFLGAAQNVTGSKYLLDVGGSRVLVDCGLYQERDLKARNWEAFPVPPNSISAVILTHAHLDHCGYLPRLVQNGFKGRVYCTQATSEVARIVMEDAAKIQEEDVRLKALRHARDQRASPFDLKPLYTSIDAQAACGLLSPCRYEVPFEPVAGLRVTFREAGHILGAASLHAEFVVEGGTRRIVFSGDLGRWDRPILRDPDVCPDADYVLVESTYGDRVHDGTESIADQLADVINATRKRGGNVIIPSFAIERSHEVLYYLNQLLREDRIPHLLVFLDSPMARKVVQVFQHNEATLDEEMRAMFAAHQSPFELPGLSMTASADESKAINHIAGTVIVIAGSGMCTGGRIKHHLINNISRKECTVLFVGYQAVGTLGRQIMDGAKEVRILGQMLPVRAQIEALHGFSAHADRNELIRWLRGMTSAPRCVFVTHGEPETAKGFAAEVTKEFGWKTRVPVYRDEVVLD